MSEDFRTLPKISEDFPKILKNHRSLFGAHIIKRTLHGFQKIWILSSRGQNISLVSLRSTREIFLPLENKSHISWKPCNILCIFRHRPCRFTTAIHKLSTELQTSSLLTFSRGDSPCIRMIGMTWMIVVVFRGCNRQFSIF